MLTPQRMLEKAAQIGSPALAKKALKMGADPKCDCSYACCPKWTYQSCRRIEETLY
jgi:hypothetical protein